MTVILDSAFEDFVNLKKITIPDSVTSIGDYAFSYCSSLASITVDESNEYYLAIDGNLFSKDETVLIQYAIGNTNTSFTIPDSVASIGYSAFSGCSSLTSITIPDSVTWIGYAAFSGCSSLETVYYTGTQAQWEDISIFSYDSNLTNATIVYNYVPEE